MMHKGMLCIVSAALVGALWLATPASAQETELQGFTVNAGVFYPSKASVRRASDDLWISVDLGYRLQTSEPTETGFYYELGVLVGYRGSGSQYYIPVHATFTGYLNEQFFYRASAGVGFPKKGRVFTDDDASFSYSLELGYNFSAGTTPIALTVGYAAISRNDVNGFTVGLQLRF
ncbi:MAG: cupredoxin domain-containing protein [Fimbriimonadales bacterium]|nr:cupredoxin domain-containing protein [Fimbriimonadales bacterium]